MFSVKATGRIFSTASQRLVFDTTKSSALFSSCVVPIRAVRCIQRATAGGGQRCNSMHTYSRLVSSPTMRQSQQSGRRFLSEEAKKENKSSSSQGGTSWWSSPEFWGAAGAIAGWGMSGAAIYDAAQQGPEVISLTMTPVLIVYSTLFARWAWVVKPQNLLLMWCHITNVVAQSNQLRRALDYKVENGQEAEVKQMVQQVGMFGAGAGAAIITGPHIRKVLSNAILGVVSTLAAADAGPFTVHFWYVSRLCMMLVFSKFRRDFF